MQRSIKFRLIRGVVVLVLVIVVVFGFFALRQNDKYFEAGLLRDAAAIIEPFHVQLSDSLPSQSNQAGHLIKLAALTAAPIYFPRLVESNSKLTGVYFIGSRGEPLFSFGSSSVTAEALKGRTEAANPSLVDLDDRHVAVAIPFLFANQNQGHSVLIYSKELFEQQHDNLLLTIAVVLIIASVIGVLGAYSLGQRITRPIIQLARHIQNSEVGNPAAWYTNNDEVKFLAERFQEMEAELNNHIEDLNREIGVRTSAEADIKRIAFHDELTGLPNRWFFNDRLKEIIADPKAAKSCVAVLFIDLDGFKHINDFHGHPVGDRLLRELGGKLKGRFRQSDTIARFGGDEFVAIVEASDRTALMSLAKDIVELCSKVKNVDDYVFTLSASIGICLYPQHGGSATELLKNADIAMYHAKSNGGNQAVVFDASMAVAVKETVQIRDDLVQAIENREFELHYQPIFNLRSKALVAVEALIRWRHPERGLVYPDTFVQIAEENGLIVEIGKWVLDEACQQFEKWRTAICTLERICINVSPKQVEHDEFLETVAQVVERASISPSSIEFELTENVLITASRESDLRLKKLREMGVNIAIDDFGTGYSSLSYLRQFPITTLKIDRSFVDDCAQDSSKIGILRAILTMTNMLSINSIAEGISREADLAIVVDENCVEGQGNLLGEALPVAEFERFLSERVDATRQEAWQAKRVDGEGATRAALDIGH